MRLRSSGSLRGAVVALAVCAAAACARHPGAPASAGGALPKAAFPLTGVDSAGGTFQLTAERGHVVVLSFGFTSCPDVCPTTLAKAKGLVTTLGDRAKDVDVVFVSVDPERDSPARLQSYVGGFDPRFHGVYVARGELAPVLAGFDVVATRRESAATAGSAGAGSAYYSIDHTGGFQIIDRAGQIEERIPPSAGVDALRASVERWLNVGGAPNAAIAAAASAPATAVVVGEGLHVVSPRARVPAGSTVGALYLRIDNATDQADRLLSVRSPGAERAEVHEVVDDRGVMRMLPRPDGVGIGPRSSLELSEGGMHIMLIGLASAEPKTVLPVELRFEHAGTIAIDAPITAP